MLLGLARCLDGAIVDCTTSLGCSAGLHFVGGTAGFAAGALRLHRAVFQRTSRLVAGAAGLHLIRERHGSEAKNCSNHDCFFEHLDLLNRFQVCRMSSRATRSGKAFAAPFFVVFLAGLTDLYDRIPRLDAGPGFRKTLTAGKNERKPPPPSNTLDQHQSKNNPTALSQQPV